MPSSRSLLAHRQQGSLPALCSRMLVNSGSCQRSPHRWRLPASSSRLEAQVAAWGSKRQADSFRFNGPRRGRFAGVEVSGLETGAVTMKQEGGDQGQSRIAGWRHWP